MSATIAACWNVHADAKALRGSGAFTEALNASMNGVQGRTNYRYTCRTDPISLLNHSSMSDNIASMPGKIKDLSGKRFERWRVIKFHSQNKNGAAIWECKCECGNTANVRGGQLTGGKSRSCGCITKEVNSARMRTHGRTKTPEFKAWQAMMQRCYNPKSRGFENYGGRGIAVCEEWISDPERFLSDMGIRPSPKHSLHRIDNDGNYDPSNCKWATKTEQANGRRCNVFLTLDGKTLSLEIWALKMGVKKSMLCKRKRMGWSDEEILTRPIRKWHP